MRFRLPRPRPLSLLQMMKAVAFGAVACACIGPMIRLREVNAVQRGWQGVVAIAVFEAVAVPLAWAGLAFVLVRRGPGRDRVILACLIASAGVAEVFACFVMVTVLWAALSPFGGLDVRTLLIDGAVIIVLGAGLRFLGRHLQRTLRPERASSDLGR